MTQFFARKVCMITVFAKNGISYPATVVHLLENKIFSLIAPKKNPDNQSFDYLVCTNKVDNNHKSLTKPYRGQFNKINFPYYQHISKIRSSSEFKVGDVIGYEAVVPGRVINIQSLTKGKGFSGGIKRFNYSKGNVSHGSQYHRGSGPMGPMRPKRVFKNVGLPGQHGNFLQTIKNLIVLDIDVQKGFLIFKGNCHGAKNALLKITVTSKFLKGNKGFEFVTNNVDFVSKNKKQLITTSEKNKTKPLEHKKTKPTSAPAMGKQEKMVSKNIKSIKPISSDFNSTKNTATNQSAVPNISGNIDDKKKNNVDGKN